ncbi:MAG: lipoate--protein ligase family protein [Myxococcota bacterium]
MSAPPLQVFAESFPERGAFDTAVSRALLESVAAGRSGENLRLYRPGNVLAFSLLDRQRPGFARAVEVARRQGFEPVLRLTGGRAAVFHDETLAFAWCRPIADARLGIHDRFDAVGDILCRALRSLGVDARLGEVPGEYCPGEHSVNVGGRIKVAGVGQRVVKGAAHVGGVVVVRDSARVRRVLEPVYDALDYPMDPDRAGSLEDASPSLTRERVADAIARVFAAQYTLQSASLDDTILEHARAVQGRQEVGTEDSAADGPAPLHAKALASP